MKSPSKEFHGSDSGEDDAGMRVADDHESNSNNSSRPMPVLPSFSTRPRERPSMNSAARRRHGKRPRPFPVTDSNPKTTKPVLQLTSATAALIVGRKGATYSEALATLRAKDRKPRRRGRPSKQVLQERQKAADLRNRLREEIHELQAQRQGVQNDSRGRDAPAPAEMEISEDESDDYSHTDQEHSPTEEPAGGHESSASDHSDHERESPCKDSADNPRHEVDSSEDDHFSSEEGMEEPVELESQEEPAADDGSHGREKPAIIRRRPGRPRKYRKKSSGTAGTHERSPSDDGGRKSKSVTLSPLSHKRREAGSTASKEEASEPCPKKRRGRPPGTTKAAMLLRDAAKFHVDKVRNGEGMGLRSRANQPERGQSDELERNDDDESRQTGEGNREQTAPPATPGDKIALRGRASFSPQTMEQKDRTISCLRNELEQTRDKLEKETSRALELEEALGLDINAGSHSTAEYDKLAAKLAETERDLEERASELNEREDQVREKDAAIRGFMAQIKSLEAELLASKSAVGHSRGLGGPSEEYLEAHLSRVTELEAAVEEKNETIENLQRLVDRHGSVLKNALKANRGMQQKIYSMNSGAS